MTKTAFQTSSFSHKHKMGGKCIDSVFTSKTFLVVSKRSEWEANVMHEAST